MNVVLSCVAAKAEPSGLSGHRMSLSSQLIASSRNPSIPRSSQGLTTSHMAARTAAFCQLRSGCSFKEGMEIVLPASSLLTRMSRRIWHSSYLVAAEGLAVCPTIPVACRGGTGPARVAEPLMLIGGVVQHQIHDDADSPLVSLLHKRVEVVERAEPWVNVDVITDIVAKSRIGEG